MAGPKPDTPTLVPAGARLFNQRRPEKTLPRFGQSHKTGRSLQAKSKKDTYFQWLWADEEFIKLTMQE